MQPQPLRPDDRQVLTSAILRQLSALPDRDWVQWTDACADDVVLCPADEPRREGRDAVLQWLQTLTPISALHPTVLEIDGQGDAAVARGSADATVFLDGAPTDVRFSWLKIFCRQDDGTWTRVSDFLAYR